MSELVFRQPCEHGKLYRHLPAVTEFCPGGSEVVLDPDKVLVHMFGQPDHAKCVTVADVLAVLDKEGE